MNTEGTILTPKSFIQAKFKSYNDRVFKMENFDSNELIGWIEEYDQVKERMAARSVKLENRPISVTEWVQYNERYQEWLNKDYPDKFSRGMSEPNPPNYYRANND